MDRRVTAGSVTWIWSRVHLRRRRRVVNRSAGAQCSSGKSHTHYLPGVKTILINAAY